MIDGSAGPGRSPADADVAIVGAGHAGLCVVAALAERGRTCTVFDDADRLGDTWRARYDGLHLNTKRSVSTIPGTVVDPSVGRWPARDEWADYVESAARQLGVERRPERVRRVERAGERWRLTSDGGAVTSRTVVIATGRNRVPEIPPWRGLDSTTIRVLHAAAYRSPDEFAGRRVLVVGAGNSGTEIAHLLCDAGVDVTLSMRTRPVWARRELFGSDLSEFARTGRGMPSWLVDLSGLLMQPLLFGRMRPYGLGPPQRRLSRVEEASGATLDSGFVDDVKAGRIPLVDALDHVDGDEVVLADGSRLTPDVVIAGTGYRPDLGDLLDPDLVGDGGWPKVTDPPYEQAPGLFTAGLNPATLTAFHPDFITEADDIADAVVSRLRR